MFQEYFKLGCALAAVVAGVALFAGFAWTCGVRIGHAVCELAVACMREDEPDSGDNLDEAYRKLCREAAQET
jgi:hypothetical protein